METIRIINLLPPERRVNLYRGLVLGSVKRFLRTILAGLVMLTVVGLTLIAGLWVVILTSAEGVDLELEQELADYNALRTEIAGRNAVLEELDSLADKRVVWSYVIGEILVVIPNGLLIKDLNTGALPPTLFLAGTAPNRSTLVTLEERLQLLPWVTNLRAPSSNLIERTNLKYDLELQIDLKRALDASTRSN